MKSSLNYKQLIKLIGKRLFAEAIKWSHDDIPRSKNELRLRIENLKGRKTWPTKKATYEHAEIVLEVAKLFREKRRSRYENRENLGNRSALLGNSEPAQLPSESLLTRAKQRKRKLILSAADGQLASYSGSTEICISTGSPSAETKTSRGKQYSRRCTYHQTDAVHTIVVPADWYTRVYRRGLGSVDGMLTLNAEPVESDGYTIYKATWMRRSGKRILAESGYVAIGENGAAHAKTESGAKAILTRRANEIKHTRHESHIRKALQEMRLSGYGEVIVTISDSLCAGNCKPGTLEFRDRHFPNRDFATVDEILAVGSMRELAINACLRAIRRAKINYRRSA